MEPSAIERRRHPRFPVNLEVAYRHYPFTQASGTTENVSLGGVFVLTSPPLNKGASVWINLFFPDASPPITADCEVVWIRSESGSSPAGMGLRFVGISPEDMERLSQYFSLWQGMMKKNLYLV